ncbi:MAG: YcaQ family DNA glycosylase [Elusimicrobia bacterium]|nr:YcaQ family DNA glycosylase [Elusimicrobiota bacterium]
MRVVDRDSVRRLFLERQHLSRPLGTKFSAASVGRFVADAGGLQLDSINVVERAHYLTLWSRFGPYDKAALDRLVYGERALVEYWAHAACLVAKDDLPAWSRVMADYRLRNDAWAGWLKPNRPTVRKILENIRERGPLAPGDFVREKNGKSGGWWDWKPAHHALHFLWMSGALAVHSRRHFQKRYDLSERVLPEVSPIPRGDFPAWHVTKTLHALGAAHEFDLARYLTSPRMAPGERKGALARLLKSGEALELKVEGAAGRWYALARDVKALETAKESSGTTLLTPFDSLLWHRARAKALFGFDYKIEVYTPAPKRVYGYYTLPILHDGRLVGRLDPKNHREAKRLEVRGVHFESKADDALLGGLAGALKSLAAFLGAEEVAARGPLRSYL